MKPIFFFSSRRRHTRWTGDWSSDVCSSDLLVVAPRELLGNGDRRAHAAARHARQKAPQALWVTIQRGEHILGSHDFVLWSAGAQGGGQGPPEPILPGIGHFQ